MSSTPLSIRPAPASLSDMETLWQAAINAYENTVGTKITSLSVATNVDQILQEVHEKEITFKKHRHDGSKMDKLRSLVKKILYPVEQLSQIVASSTSSLFPPSTVIFTALSYLFKVVNSVSSDYDQVAELLEDLVLYLNRLKILETSVPSVPELQIAITEVLTSVLILCGICTEYIRRKRIVKGFQNLFSGKDEKLANAYAHFHKMVEQEKGAVSNATLAAASRLEEASTDIRAKMQDNLAVAQGTRQDIEVLLRDAQELRKSLQVRNVATNLLEVHVQLSSLDFLEKQKDVYARHYQGTGQWLLDSQEFKQWFNSPDPMMFWCPGIPGAGKTVMTSSVVTFIEGNTRGEQAAIVYIYCDYKDTRTHTESNLLSSIARQLTEQLSFVPLEVKNFVDQMMEIRRSPSVDEWLSLITSIRSHFQSGYILVDAMDECPERNRESFLCNLQSLQTFFKIFITSRPHLDLQRHFKSIFRLDIVASSADLKLYVQHFVSMNGRLSSFIAKDDTLEEAITRSVVTKAGDMFLLVHLQLDHLARQSSVKTVRRAIESLPQGIFAYYDQAMDRIRNQSEEDSELAEKALGYVFAAERPLKIGELLHALSVETGDTDYDSDALPEVDILLNVCAGLLLVDDSSGTVGLVHLTLQEYIAAHHKLITQSCELRFAQTCLTYLSFDIFEAGPCASSRTLRQRLQHYPFMYYASHHWGDHVAQGHLTPDLSSLLLVFLKNEKKVSSSIQVLHLSSSQGIEYDRFPTEHTPLHVAAYWGLNPVLSTLTQGGVDINARNSHGWTSLQLAASRGHTSFVKFLLSREAQIDHQNHDGETALYWAARAGHDTTVEQLLAGKADVLIKDNEGWTALDWAANWGNIKILKMLLNRGSDVAEVADGKQRALVLAATEGHNATVQMLLEDGVDASAQDPEGSTALDWAVSFGHEDTVRTLLNHGADVTSQDEFGNSIMHWAVSSLELTRLLLEAGAESDLKNGIGQTALCWAAQDGPITVVELLVKNGAEVNTQDEYGWTPLHRAALRGRAENMRCLLEHGSDPELRDNFQWTALHLATLKQHKSIARILMDRTENGRTILSTMTRQLGNDENRALLEEMVEDKAQANSVVTGLRAAIQARQLGRSRALLKKGADVNAKDVGGWTALILAVSGENEQAVRLLLEHGADTELSGFDGRTALHWACELGHQKIVELLLDHGAKVDTRAFMWTGMLLAAKEQHEEVLRYLLERNADVSMHDYHRRTCLHWAARHSNIRMIRMIVAHGCQLDALDRWDRTPLMLAVQNGRMPAIEALLQSGAAVNQQSRYGLTALHIAAFAGWEDITRYLVAQGADLGIEAHWRIIEDREYFEIDKSDSIYHEIADVLRHHWHNMKSAANNESNSKQGLTAGMLAESRGHEDLQDILLRQRKL